MTSSVTSKYGLIFLTQEAFITSIRAIESYLPGWWWSIAQRKDVIDLSMGPGRNCPNPLDVAFAKTAIGDGGFINAYSFFTQNDEPGFIEWVDKQCRQVDAHRIHMRRDNPDLPDHNPDAIYRKQSDYDLQSLGNWYTTFLNDIPLLESRTHVITTLHLGSCDFSADCSIRGTKYQGEEFDITCDLTGKDDTIAETLECVLTETRNDILTPVQG